MTETVTISALGHGGDGIAETRDGRVFVPFTLPGETVRIERSGNRGRLVDITAASPLRAAPPCRHFGTCGGCALQHMEREAYLAWKREMVARTLALAGIEAEVDPVVPAATGNRRRAVFSAVKDGARRDPRLSSGAAATRSSPIEECPVLVPAIVGTPRRSAAIAEIAVKPRRTARLTVLAADNGLDIAVTGGGRIDAAALEALGRLAGDEPSPA